MIDIRKLKELVKLMVENDLSELDLRDEQEAVVLRRAYSSPAPVPAAVPVAAPPAPAAGAPSAAAPGDEIDEGLQPITSPMVGSFYAAPDPDSPPYISVGDRVTPETVVCIVEAMKVFSEIKAGCTGVVEKVLVKNTEPVEYGQDLFLVRVD